MPWLHDERAIVRAAIDLGATNYGGDLSVGESSLVAQSRSCARVPDSVLAQLREAVGSGEDPLGAALCLVRSPVNRRDMGAFYTPQSLASPMMNWVLERKPIRLIDPGCGSGRFTQIALLADPTIQTISIDLDPLATLMTRATLSVLKRTRSIVCHADYTTFRINPISGRTAFIGNPPYVRHHQIPREAKERVAKIALNLGHNMSQLAGMHAYFFVATAALATCGDVGCFVTSSEWMDVNYGKIVRDLLLNALGGTGIHAFGPRAIPFDDAMTTAAITFFEVGSKTDRMLFLMSDEPTLKGGLGVGANAVSKRTLEKSCRWSPFLRDSAVGEVPLATLGSVARVSRGQVTGGNEFFVMNRHRALQLGIEEFCRPAITSARQIIRSSGVVRDTPDLMVVLEVPEDIDRSKYPELDAYLKTGEAPVNGQPPISERWIPSHRRVWWSVKVPAPKIVASYMARQAPWFALNPDGVGLLNIGHGLYPRVNMTADDLRSLVESLNGMREGFVGLGRTYHGGLEKFEPKEMENLPIPDHLAERILRK